MVSRHNFITGLPGSGKTTLIRKLCDELRPLNPVGFYTSEIRERSVRKGFELVTLDNRRGLLSHVDIKRRHRVGRYGVDIPGFESFLDEINFLGPDHRLIVIDEIGKMECLSMKFCALLSEILDSDRPVLATIAQKGGGLIAEIKRRPDVRLFQLTVANRDRLGAEIVAALA